MTRRIVRTFGQLIVVAFTIFFLVIFLDNRYDVLPTSIHNHLPAHHPGLVITDINVQSCYRFNPFSVCRLDPNEWVRLEKDLYLYKSVSSQAFLHVKRKQEEDLKNGDKVVLDVKVGRLDPSQEGETKHGRWEQRNAGIWILRSAKRHESDSKHAITAVDVLFGSDAAEPRPGWEIKGTPLFLEASSTSLEAHITVRSGTPKQPEKPVLKFKTNGRFKIMQAADLHLSTGVGKCRDADSKGRSCEADTKTLEFVGRLLDEERPDLVVLTGDQVNGETSPDPQSAIYKMADLFIKHKVPYASIFGNHDDLGPLSRSDSMALLEVLPYSLSNFGPTAVSGVGNYVVEVEASGGSHHSAVSLYFLDTHGKSPDEKQFPGYNWLKDNQINWFKSTVQSLKGKHAQFSRIHLDMAFIHIPFPEYVLKGNKYKGQAHEAVSAPKFNSHFKDALVEEDVKLITAGHDHVNDYCSLDKGEGGKPRLWMCYAGGAGFGGYGGHGGYVRRIRFFEFDTNGGTIRTWKRLESGDTKQRLDVQTVVEQGKAMDLE